MSMAANTTSDSNSRARTYWPKMRSESCTKPKIFSARSGLKSELVRRLALVLSRSLSIKRYRPVMIATTVSVSAVPTAFKVISAVCAISLPLLRMYSFASSSALLMPSRTAG